MKPLQIIDSGMLWMARLFIGALFVENTVPIFVKWFNPYLDARGLPHVGAPLGIILLAMVSLWFLQRFIFRLILALFAILLSFVSAVALFVAVEGLGMGSVIFRDNFYGIVLMETFIFLGLGSIFWVCFRPPHVSGESFISGIQDSVHSV